MKKDASLEEDAELYEESLLAKSTLDNKCPFLDWDEACKEQASMRCEENNYFRCPNYWHLLDLYERKQWVWFE